MGPRGYLGSSHLGHSHRRRRSGSRGDRLFTFDCPPFWTFVNYSPTRSSLNGFILYRRRWWWRLHFRRRRRSFNLKIDQLGGNLPDRGEVGWRCTLGLQSGEYSPPAPCFDFTAISSEISLILGQYHMIKQDANDALLQLSTLIS